MRYIWRSHSGTQGEDDGDILGNHGPITMEHEIQHSMYIMSVTDILSRMEMNVPSELRRNIFGFIGGDALFSARCLGLSVDDLLDELEDLGYDPKKYLCEQIFDEYLRQHATWEKYVHLKDTPGYYLSRILYGKMASMVLSSDRYTGTTSLSLSVTYYGSFLYDDVNDFIGRFAKDHGYGYSASGVHGFISATITAPKVHDEVLRNLYIEYHDSVDIPQDVAKFPEITHTNIPDDQCEHWNIEDVIQFIGKMGHNPVDYIADEIVDIRTMMNDTDI